MPKTKRKRAPGAGRPPIDPRGSVIAQVRFSQADWDGIESLAAQHKSNASQEIRNAVKHWQRLLLKPARHVGLLMYLVAILVRKIEERSGRKWHEDPMTGVAVYKGLERLIYHFAPASAETLVIPPELENLPGELITIMENLVDVQPTLLGDDWAVLARIVQDLGSGWERNREVWLDRKEGVK